MSTVQRSEPVVKLRTRDGLQRAVLYGTPDLCCFRCTKPMLCDWVLTTSQDTRWAFTCLSCCAKFTLAMEVADGHVTAVR
jgi:hypothetical protein